MGRINIEEFSKVIIKEGEIMEFYLNNEKYNGFIFEMFNHKLASEFEVKEGIKNGSETIYYEDGTIENVCMYLDGHLSGITKNFSKKGVLEEEAFFEKGICLWYKLFDEKGNITETFEIDIYGDDYKLLEKYRNRGLE